MKVIYTGAFRFPNGDAASQRVLNNAKIFRELGYSVEFISWGGTQRIEDRCEDGFYYYQGFKYRNTKDIDNKENLGIIGRADSYLRRGRHSLGLIKEMIKDTTFIIVYNPSVYITYKLLSLCKKNNVLCISDITEWYAADELPGGKFALPYWMSEYNMRVVQKRVQNKIVISSFLNKYYSESNNIVLPPLLDNLDEKWIYKRVLLSDCHCIRVMYAGSPGKKDRLDIMLEAVLDCLKEEVKIQFIVIGVSYEDIENYKCYKEVISFPDNIQLLGRLYQQNVPAYYQISDFSLLVRENNRKNRAGFPTKLTESLMAGCPAIVNYTSDISEYVKNEINGIVISDFTKDSVIKALKNAAILDRKSIAQMKINAKALAYKNFDYLGYKEKASGFVRNIRKGK